MPAKHSIDTLAVQFTSHRSANDNLVRSIARKKDEITSIIHEVFDRYAPVDSTITLEKLQLDLGTLSSKEFPHHFNNRLRNLLELELKKFFTRSDVNVYIQHTANSNALNPFELLERYLLYGFNEQLQQSKDFDPELFMLKLYSEDKIKLASVVTSAWKNRNAQKRLLQFTGEAASKLKYMLPLQEYASLSGERNTANRALQVIITYYNTGYFPIHTRNLRWPDLDVLIKSVQQTNNRELLRYIQNNIKSS
jgi:hypothetical protein